ncbi:MAG: hypothetical protein RLZZ598_1899 [Pseudomonadota bacterium]|jgi:uroporphyrinogen-III synthase
MSGPSRRLLLVTRPAAQAEPARRALRAVGVEAVALPLIGITPLADLAPVSALWQTLERWQLVIFVSQNAVAHFFAARPAGAVWPAHTLAAGPGPGTAAALRSAGVPNPQIVAPAASGPQDSEALWAALAPRYDWPAARVLLLRGADAGVPSVDTGVGREWLAATLGAAGAELRLQAVYRRGPAVLSPHERALLSVALAAPARHVWLFASAEAVEHLRTIASELGTALPVAPGAAIATHPRIADRARAAGFDPVLLCAGDPASLRRCLEAWPDSARHALAPSIEFPSS